MKQTTLILLTILIFFQSCYSYKKVDIKNLKIDTSKKYAIKTKKILGKKKYLKIIKITDTVIIVLKKKKQFSIPISKILKIKEMKFSYWRTGILTFVIIGTISGLRNWSIGLGGNGNYFEGLY